MSFKRVTGGVSAPRGFLAAGVASGIKTSGKEDLALLMSEKPASVAGVFTTNLAAAAPVQVCRERISSGIAQAVIVNAGCANACTGQKGLQDAFAMADVAAAKIDVAPELVLVCSTGLIGSYLPMEKVTLGIAELVGRLSQDDSAAALSIMTTDTVPKTCALEHSDGWSIGGMAKGAAMIAPNMATMLAFITTDAIVEPRVLQASLKEAVDVTFNAITIDGDTSTNDSVLAFANGASEIEPGPEDFFPALLSVCRTLAEKIVADGEGATKFVRVRARGAATEEDARRAARAIAESTLVKTALFGQDPNWGRVVAAVGKAGVAADYSKMSVTINGLSVLNEGVPAGAGVRAQAKAGLADPEITLVCDLYAGEFSAEVLTTDLSTEYVLLNSEYET
ncbi:MAG TPA: bifunctional glutamate N-acetyltransferase/amino-acid acetyltransferase ArgJ [Actinomycetota bacterium]|nr:bifunctional glutamate N-acetyltransferase/amino-acid acetyltransferase ArgJ [Actinomycetota bacterium]